MIKNVIVQKALFEDCKAIRLIADKAAANKFQKSTYQNIIAYQYDILIITTNVNVIDDFPNNVLEVLQKFGLNFSKVNFNIIPYKKRSCIFNYLGYNLNYITSTSVERGNVLSCFNKITNQKYAKTEKATYGIYPSSKKI